MTIGFLIDADPQAALGLVLVAGAAAALGAPAARWLTCSDCRHTVVQGPHLLRGASVHSHVRRHVPCLGSSGCGPCAASTVAEPSSMAASSSRRLGSVCTRLGGDEQDRAASSRRLCTASGHTLRSRARSRHRSADHSRPALAWSECCWRRSSFRSPLRSPRAGNWEGRTTVCKGLWWERVQERMSSPRSP